MSSVVFSHAPNRYALGSVSSPVLIRQLDTLARQELPTDADVLAHIAELDWREEYLQLGFPSMHDYCVRRLRMSEDRANKRIRTCRTALEYPVMFRAFAMIADGRLNVSSVLMLKARLTPENATPLLADAASLSNEALELLLARRFPRIGAAGDAPALELMCGIAGDSVVEVAARPLPVLPNTAIDAGSTGPFQTREPSHRAAPAGPALYARFTPLSGESVALRGQLSMAHAAARSGIWNWTTSCRSGRAAGPRSTTSGRGAARTIATRPSASSARHTSPGASSERRPKRFERDSGSRSEHPRSCRTRRTCEAHAVAADAGSPKGIQPGSFMRQRPASAGCP